LFDTVNPQGRSGGLSRVLTIAVICPNVLSDFQALCEKDAQHIVDLHNSWMRRGGNSGNTRSESVMEVFVDGVKIWSQPISVDGKRSDVRRGPAGSDGGAIC